MRSLAISHQKIFYMFQLRMAKVVLLCPPALLQEIEAQGLNVFQYCDAARQHHR